MQRKIMILFCQDIAASSYVGCEETDFQLYILQSYFFCMQAQFF